MYIYEPIYKEDRSISLSSKKIDTKYDNEVVQSAQEASILAAKIARDLIQIQRKPEEHMYMFFLDLKPTIFGFSEISHGSSFETDFGTREIILRSMLTGASDIILLHNHPAADPKPSRPDLNRTLQVMDTLSTLNIQLWDHIIIGKNGSMFSINENTYQRY